MRKAPHPFPCKPRFSMIGLALLATACSPRESTPPPPPTPSPAALLPAPVRQETELRLAQALGPAEAQTVITHLAQSMERSEALLEQAQAALQTADWGQASPPERLDGGGETAPNEAKIRSLLERLQAAIAMIDDMEAEAIGRGEELPPYLWEQREQLKDTRQAIHYPVTTLQMAQECELGSKCQGNNPGWAQYILGADLADERVKAIYSQLPIEDRVRLSPTIGVVDSGFDWEGQKHSLKSYTAETFAGHGAAADGALDPNGHGTAVAGMIFGALTGVTEFGKLRSYRMTTAGSGGTVTSAQLSQAVIKACDESDVVNVSWGSLSDEMGVSDFSKEEWYKHAQAKGCIVVKASGNYGFKTQASARTMQSALKPGSPVLLAGAMNEFGSEASFSTRSVYLTPGQGVFTLMSKQVKRESGSAQELCTIRNQLIGPISGTSFAAPYLAGITGQILAVLNAQGKLPQSPSEKLVLVRKILDGARLWSEWTGRESKSVNALAAVRIAESYSGQKPSATTPEQLFASAKAQFAPQCDAPLPACEDKKFCYSKRSCVNKVRERDFLCRGAPQSRAYLIGLLRTMQEPQLIAGLLSNAGGAQTSSDPALADLEQLWERNVYEHSRKFPPLRVDSFEKAVNILDLAAKRGLGKRFITVERALMLIPSSDFEYGANRNLRDLADGKVSTGDTALLKRLIDALPYADTDALAKGLDPFAAPGTGAPKAKGSLARLHLAYLLRLKEAQLSESSQKALNGIVSKTAQRILRHDPFLAEIDLRELESGIYVLGEIVKSAGLPKSALAERIESAPDGSPLLAIGLLSEVLPGAERALAAKTILQKALSNGAARGTKWLSAVFETLVFHAPEAEILGIVEHFERLPGLALPGQLALKDASDRSAFSKRFGADAAFRSRLAGAVLEQIEALTHHRPPFTGQAELDTTVLFENLALILFTFDENKEKEQWPLNQALFASLKPRIAPYLQRAARAYSREGRYNDPEFWIDYGLKRFLEKSAKARDAFEAWKDEDWLREQLLPLRGREIKDSDLKKWIEALFK